MYKIEIWFKYNRKHKEWTCGIGDGIVDGIWATAKTKEKAGLKLIAAYNKDKVLNITM